MLGYRNGVLLARQNTFIEYRNGDWFIALCLSFDLASLDAHLSLTCSPDLCGHARDSIIVLD